MTPARYHGVAIVLHWLVAVLVFGQLALGWWMIGLPDTPRGIQAPWFNLHKSIGLTIALLVLARLAWRASHPAPPLPPSLPRWQARAARWNHAALYACLVLLPLTGYLGSTFSGYPIKYFGMTLPGWGWSAPALKSFFSAAHFSVVLLLMALLALHVAAALRHLLVTRDGVFWRMWPRGVLFAVLLAGAPGGVAAQEDADAVVVTATRAPRPSLEVPASVDRIYADEIREGRPQVNLSESLGRVPGITVQNRQNYAQDLQISSRGFGARSTFGVRGIRLIADGIPASMPDGQGQAATFALGSAERIEVLRGPFSSLYGNASGGVIAVDTEDGPDPPAGTASLLYGSYDTWRAGLKFGGQWKDLNAIAELSRFETDGYRRHSAAVRDHFNAKLRFGLSEASSLTVVTNSLRQPETEDPLGLTRAQFDADPRQAVPQAFTFNTRKSIYQDQLGATFSHRFSGSRVEATAYAGERWVEQFLAIPLATQSAPTHSGGVINLDRRYGGAALRYFTDFAALRLSAGLEYEAMEEQRRGFINNNGTAGALKRDEDNEVTSTDVFAQAEWKLAERWALHGGVRHSRVEFTSDDHFIAPGNPDDSGARSYSATTPVAGLLFKAARNTSLYANIGRGFETPTFVELAHRASGSGLNTELDASRSRHAELGLKTVIPGWARVNVALFDVATKNEIVVEQNTGGRATFKNAGRTDRQGIELAAETLFVGMFQARVAYTRLDAEFRDSFDTVAGLPAVPVTVPAGNLIPGVPRSQLYAELRLRRDWFYAHLEALRRSRVAVNDLNSEFADGFTVYNLVGGLVQEFGRWRLTEFVRIDNVTDRNYAGSVIVNDGNGRYYEPSPRRNTSVGLQARYAF